MKKVYSLIVLSLIFGAIHAQNYDFGKVSIEELQQQSFAKDTTINAAVLYCKNKIYYEYTSSQGFELVKEVHKRIKLYKKEGFNYGTYVVDLYKNGSDEEQVLSLKATTYNLVNGTLEKTKMGKESIFKSEYSEHRNQVKFTLPKLQEGAVIEYRYKIRSPFLANVGRIVLQDYIPIVKMEAELAAVEYFNFRKFTSGYLPVNLQETTVNGSLVIEGQRYDNKVNKFKVYANGVPPFKKEPYSGNTKNYISAVTFELSYVKYGDGSTKHYATTWEDVAKRVFESSSFGGELSKNSYFKEDVDQLLAGVTVPEEKAAKIFDFVKQKVKWNDGLSLWSGKGVKKAYKEGTGNSADVNLMLAAMLKYAKLDVDMVLVGSTRKVISLFPTIDGFDDVVCRVKFDDNKVIYLDASDAWSAPNILPARVRHGNGKLIAKSGAVQTVDFRTKKPSKSQFTVQCEIDEEGTVKGKVRCNQKEYLAYNFRNKYAQEDEEGLSKRIQEKFELTTIEDYEYKGLKKFGKGITEQFGFEAQNQAEVIGDEIFFSPLLFLKDTENVFKSDERKYPVDFGYGYSNNYMVNIKIPEGYAVSEVPKNGAFKLPENMGVFTYQLNATPGIIQLRVSETISSPLIMTSYYKTLKEFFNQVIAKENEQVVLKKV